MGHPCPGIAGERPPKRRCKPRGEPRGPVGPRWGRARGGQSKAAPAGAERGTGLGGVAGFGAVRRRLPWPPGREAQGHWGSAFLPRLQDVRGICKTRNQLIDYVDDLVPEDLLLGKRVRG